MRWRGNSVSIAAVSLFIGLLASIGTAGYGYWRNVPYPTPRPLRTGGLTKGSDGRQWTWFSEWTRWYTNFSFDLPVPGPTPEPPAQIVAAVKGVQADEEAYGECRYGYPWRCFRAAAYFGYDREPRERLTAGFNVGVNRQGAADQGYLPTGILLGGLASNVALYGGATFAVLRLWSAIAMWRKASGCARCGYSRRGLAANAPCPECGLVP